jgi:protein SCO1/2
MPARTMNKVLRGWPLLLCSSLLAGCHPAPPAEAPPLQGAAIGGPFRLIDQDGHPFASQQLRGRYAVIYFGYTFCPDACPTAMQVLAQGVKKLAARDPAKAAKLQTVFISVDPARDTPPVLKQFVRAFSPTLVGLTGPEDAIERTAKEYAVFFQKQAPVAGASGYLMQHQTTPILFGPDGKPIALVPVDADAGQVADLLAKWIA